ncbi:hypothetical protein HPP92_004008 [Vanilla planifolia]|uniref:Uncharacterized protein n=1 Tax=Vanilla planifolia TaxID=51239 RepID=A0A835S891_VANPL|nr:hypothetical protein HPP92_004008 [Vanilla planifolia]
MHFEGIREWKPPNPADLKSTFVDQIGISTAGDFEFEIRFLEEQICIREKKKKKNILPAVNCFSVEGFLLPISLDLCGIRGSLHRSYLRPRFHFNWLDTGNHLPQLGEIRDSAASVPNRALRSLISQWCASKGVPYDDIKTTWVETT